MLYLNNTNGPNRKMRSRYTQLLFYVSIVLSIFALTFRRLMSTIVDVPHRYPPKFHFIFLFNKYRYRIL